MILLDNIIFSLQKNAGGISKAWAKHLQYISKLRSDIRLWEQESALENKFRKDIDVAESLQAPGAQSHMLSRIFPSFPKADIVHSSYYRAQKGRKNSVITVHDFIQELYPSSWKDGLFAALKKRALSNADTIIVVSQHTLKDMHSLYPWTKEKNTHVIHNGVDEEYFQLAEREAIPLGSNTADELLPDSYFLYVGNRGYCKNFAACKSFLSHDLAREEKLKLVIVGGGPLTPTEKELFVPYLDRLVLVPFASNQELNRLYNGARALLFPSLYEGFGIPALEAARTGCIVLASNQSSVPEVVGPSPFMFDPRSESEMQAATDKLSDENIVKQEKKRLLEHAASFGWQKNAEETNNLYDQLLGK